MQKNICSKLKTSLFLTVGGRPVRRSDGRTVNWENMCLGKMENGNILYLDILGLSLIPIDLHMGVSFLLFYLILHFILHSFSEVNNVAALRLLKLDS